MQHTQIQHRWWMLPLLRGIAAMIAAAALTACGADQEIRINGRVDGMGTGNLKLVFYSHDAVQNVTATAIDGKFMMTGRIDRPTLVRIYSNTGIVLGRMAIEPGETVDLNLNLREPWVMSAEGNTDSGYLADFLKDNAPLIQNANRKELNDKIEEYVRRYPKRGVSAILLADYYTAKGNEARAAELLEALSPDARRLASTQALEMMTAEMAQHPDSLRMGTLHLFSDADSLETIEMKGKRPTVLFITDADSRYADSITATLSKLRGRYLPLGGARLIDVGVDADTIAWHRSIRGGEEKEVDGVRHFWSLSPRHISGLEQIPVGSVPWFIVADSTGRVIHSSSTLPR